MSERGFVVNDNLRESDNTSKDERIIDNLGGEGTSGNFRLFSGNLRRESYILQVNNFTYDSNTKFYNTLLNTGSVAFSNDTKVSLRIEGGPTVTDGIVESSNGIDKFKIRLSNNSLDIPEISPLTKLEIVRNDGVTIENIKNLKIDRLNTLPALGNEGNILSTTNQGEQSLFKNRSIAIEYDIIDGSISSFYYKQSRVPLSYKETSFDREFVINGNITVTNDENIALSNTSPGVFILKDDVYYRSFSKDLNPWTETSNTLSSSVDNVSIKKLRVKNPTLNIDNTSNVVSNTVVSATHKYPITIIDENGNREKYFILLKED